jgi:hypothetical protein
MKVFLSSARALCVSLTFLYAHAASAGLCTATLSLVSLMISKTPLGFYGAPDTAYFFELKKRATDITRSASSAATVRSTVTLLADLREFLSHNPAFLDRWTRTASEVLITQTQAAAFSHVSRYLNKTHDVGSIWVETSELLRSLPEQFDGDEPLLAEPGFVENFLSTLGFFHDPHLRPSMKLSKLAHLGLDLIELYPERELEIRTHFNAIGEQLLNASFANLFVLPTSTDETSQKKTSRLPYIPRKKLEARAKTPARKNRPSLLENIDIDQPQSKALPKVKPTLVQLSNQAERTLEKLDQMNQSLALQRYRLWVQQLEREGIGRARTNQLYLRFFHDHLLRQNLAGKSAISLSQRTRVIFEVIPGVEHDVALVERIELEHGYAP